MSHLRWYALCLIATMHTAAEKQVLRDQASSQAKGAKPKPANIIEKIISGRVNKVCDSCIGTLWYVQHRTVHAHMTEFASYCWAVFLSLVVSVTSTGKSQVSHVTTLPVKFEVTNLQQQGCNCPCINLQGITHSASNDHVADAKWCRD